MTDSQSGEIVDEGGRILSAPTMGAHNRRGGYQPPEKPQRRMRSRLQANISMVILLMCIRIRIGAFGFSLILAYVRFAHGLPPRPA